MGSPFELPISDERINSQSGLLLVNTYKNMKFMASCLFGLEKLVCDDIAALGYTKTEVMDGHIVFEAPISAIAECNVNFRYAERLLLVIGDFEAATFTQLFDAVNALPWEDYITKNAAFPVKGHSIRSKLFSVPDCQRIIKKAVVERLKNKYGVSYFDESAEKYQIVFFIFKDRAYLMLDTSGDSLHKRGYRPESNAAPIRETLAAALVTFSRPRSDIIFVDPMCGSGTIAIEAAMIDRHIAPGMNRGFAAEEFAFLKNSRMMADAREKALDLVTPGERLIFGSDIDEDCVILSKSNARRAGVEKNITFTRADACFFRSPVEGARGTVVCNPPYGERMGDRESASRLIHHVGEAMADAVPNWQLYFISDNTCFERDFGRRADKKRPLYNGMLRCTLYQYFKPQITKN